MNQQNVSPRSFGQNLAKVFSFNATSRGLFVMFVFLAVFI